MDIKYFCFISGKQIPEERVEFLRDSGLDPVNWTCVEHSITKAKKGVYCGDENTELMIVDSVQDVSVNDIFRQHDEAEYPEIPTSEED